MLGEDNSDPIKVHPELNSGSSSRPSVRARNFSQNFGREHVNAPINTTRLVGDYEIEAAIVSCIYEIARFQPSFLK